MIGVRTRLPVGASASSPSARISSSHRVSSRASARPAGRPAAASSGSDERAAAPGGGGQLGGTGGVEDLAADGLVERADGGASVLGPDPRGDPQQPQPWGVAVLVADRKGSVVDAC